MGMEAQNVIALRMLRLATGGARRMKAEASRMGTNKVAAAADQPVAAVSAALNGHSPHVVTSKAPRAPKKRARANKRRRSRR